MSNLLENSYLDEILEQTEISDLEELSSEEMSEIEGGNPWAIGIGAGILFFAGANLGFQAAKAYFE